MVSIGLQLGMVRLTKRDTIVKSLIALVWVVASGTISASTACADSKTLGLIREEDRLGARSDEYSRVFERAVAALVRGDAAAFRALLSNTTTLNESRGPGAIDAVIQTRFIPFFSDFSELTESITTVPTYDAAGSTGLAIARSFTTSEGERRSFVIYLIREKNRVVVGNLLPNATAEDLRTTGKGDVSRRSERGASTKAPR